MAADGGVAAAAMDHLSQRDFDRLARFIQDYSGIKMPASKKTMVEGRLRRRVRAHGLPSLQAYCRMLFDDDGLAGESVHLIDAVTTNKTEFFREPEHFRFMTETMLPAIVGARTVDAQNPVQVWSAAGSSGAEPYTLAMVLAEFAQRSSGFRWSVLATDICTEVLETAFAGIYPESMVAPVPAELRRRYLLRSRDRARNLVRIAPELRRQVRFQRLNLMDASYPVQGPVDIVFCRNILIYFDRPTQQAVLARLCTHLRPGGFLVLGHSETLSGFDLPVTAVGPTVFRHA